MKKWIVFCISLFALVVFTSCAKSTDNSAQTNARTYVTKLFTVDSAALQTFGKTQKALKQPVTALKAPSAQSIKGDAEKAIDNLNGKFKPCMTKKAYDALIKNCTYSMLCKRAYDAGCTLGCGSASFSGGKTEDGVVSYDYSAKITVKFKNGKTGRATASGSLQLIKEDGAYKVNYNNIRNEKGLPQSE